MNKKLIFRKSIDYSSLQKDRGFYVPQNYRKIFNEFSGELTKGESVEADAYIDDVRVPVPIYILREKSKDDADKILFQYHQDERIPLYIEKKYPISCAYIRALKNTLENSKKHAKLPKHQDVQISIYGIGFRKFEFVCEDRETITMEDVNTLKTKHYQFDHQEKPKREKKSAPAPSTTETPKEQKKPDYSGMSKWDTMLFLGDKGKIKK